MQDSKARSTKPSAQEATRRKRTPSQIYRDIEVFCRPDFKAGIRGNSINVNPTNGDAFTYTAQRNQNSKYDKKAKKHVNTTVSKRFTSRKTFYAPKGSQYGQTTTNWDGRYVMVSDSMDMPAMLQALDIIPPEVGDSRESILIFPKAVLAKFDEMQGFYDDLLASGCECLYDERDEDAILVCDDLDLKTIKASGLPRRFISYRADTISQDLLFVMLREKYLNRIRDTWSKIGVNRKKNVNGRGNPASSISRANKFANLLLLGRGDFSVFEKKGKMQKWKAEQLNGIRIPESLYGQEVADAVKTVQKLDDVCSLWERNCASYWIKISIDDEDIDNEEDLDKRFGFLGNVFGVDYLIDALDEGISAEDILTGGNLRGY